MSLLSKEGYEHRAATQTVDVLRSRNSRTHAANALCSTVMPLNHYCQQFSTTDTSAHQTSLRATCFHRINEGRQDPHSCRSDRNRLAPRCAVDIHLSGIESQLTIHDQ